MNSQITEDFLACFGRLPDAVKAQARKAYRLWRENPSHPSLHYKRIHGHDSLYAVRIGLAGTGPVGRQYDHLVLDRVTCGVRTAHWPMGR